jgi:exopolyphosphatase/pppGpp-phosphohydrolase
MGRLVASRRPFGQPEAGVLLDALRDAVDEPLREVRALRPSALVFASGTARAVRQLFMRDTARPGKTGPLSLGDLRHGLGEHLGSSPELLEAKGVDPARSDTVLVAASIMSVIAEAVGVEQFRISDRGLRDGVALELYQHVHRQLPALSSSL